VTTAAVAAAAIATTTTTATLVSPYVFFPHFLSLLLSFQFSIFLGHLLPLILPQLTLSFFQVIACSFVSIQSSKHQSLQNRPNVADWIQQ
jgi:hypothetical protein